MATLAFTVLIQPVALAGAVLAAGVQAAAPVSPLSLPGAAGPQAEYVGQPPHDNQVVEAFVYEVPEQSAVGAVRPRRFPAGVAKLKLDLRLKAMPRTGVRVRYELLTPSGPLAMSDEGLVTINWMRTLEVASMDFELFPREGPFPDGPYRLRLFMNDVEVAILNWSVGGTAAAP
ncbi:MAG: hypothetical protein HY701_07800 [Gemmatimonadetes bacterium]|nr:hypothetical protein [Gemmatimonadota bacterium]